jgi:flavin-dependent dehydrogenase
MRSAVHIAGSDNAISSAHAAIRLIQTAGHKETNHIALINESVMWYQQERVACMRIWVRDVLPKLDYALF